MHHVRDVLGMSEVRIILRTGQPGQAPEHDEAPALTRQALAGIVPIALIFLIVFGGIYGGYFTPTEGAIAASMWALCWRNSAKKTP